MMKNPVMFVVEVGAAMTTVSWCATWPTGAHIVGFGLQITLWLWFTVLFANFAEAMAEGRGKAQADTLRKTKTETTARIEPNGGGKTGGLPPRSCAPATSCWWKPARPFLATAT